MLNRDRIGRGASERRMDLSSDVTIYNIQEELTVTMRQCTFRSLEQSREVYKTEIDDKCVNDNGRNDDDVVLCVSLPISALQD